ncbi:Protein kinase superfamily protein [Prunus dulcis]|uniref:Protein kinase superfamily protein n=1 Tax=Prunus dulcis TaxID=3755 RepID=A0A4Y1QZB6_PRUDU|nr:Protein kinase superfamily protein [Prunus dulcis]
MHPICCDENYHDPQSVASVIKIATGNMELVEVAPKLDKLRSLLFENPYISEEDVENGGTGRDGRKEHRTALLAVGIYGYWRIVDEKYMDRILRMLLHNSVLNDWSLSCLNEDDVVNALESDGFPHKLANHCLHVYGSKMVEGVSTVVYGSWMRGRFTHQHWTRKVPEGMPASLDMLEGEVLIQKLGAEIGIQAFSVSSLPYNLAKRFSVLFKERPKWSGRIDSPISEIISLIRILSSSTRSLRNPSPEAPINRRPHSSFKASHTAPPPGSHHTYNSYPLLSYCFPTNTQTNLGIGGPLANTPRESRKREKEDRRLKDLEANILPRYYLHKHLVLSLRARVILNACSRNPFLLFSNPPKPSKQPWLEQAHEEQNRAMAQSVTAQSYSSYDPMIDMAAPPPLAAMNPQQPPRVTGTTVPPAGLAVRTTAPASAAVVPSQGPMAGPSHLHSTTVSMVEPHI